MPDPGGLRHRRRGARVDPRQHLRHRPDSRTRNSNAIVTKEVDMTPRGIIRRLDLRRPIYRKTAAYGHFGRNDKDFTWEKLDLVKTLHARCAESTSNITHSLHNRRTNGFKSRTLQSRRPQTRRGGSTAHRMGGVAHAGADGAAREVQEDETAQGIPDRRLSPRHEGNRRARADPRRRGRRGELERMQPALHERRRRRGAGRRTASRSSPGTG